MRARFRHLGIAAGALAFVVGCSSGPAKIPAECSLVQALTGFTVDVAPPLAQQVRDVTVYACWDAVCQDRVVPLIPATAPGATGCTGELCSAQASPTGGRHGVVELPLVRETLVRATLVFRDAQGGTVLTGDAGFTAHLVHPNGGRCGGEGYQGSLTVAADGTITGS
jgi:hypothetical protein